MSRRASLLAAALSVLLWTGCDSDSSPAPESQPPKPRPTVAPSTQPPDDRRPAQPTLAARAPWKPSDAESFPNAKTLAASFAQAVTTFPAGSTPASVASSAGAGTKLNRAELADRISPLVSASDASAGEVIYPQMAGHAERSAGVMVLVRQATLDARGTRRSVTRVLDVRLSRRPPGPWRLERLGGIGGSATSPPAALPREARRALVHPGLFLPDSARWDVFRGEVDPALLDALADAADRRPISVLVLKSGHPRNVWSTARRSAHSAGRAADVYAIAGQLVAHQRRAGSAAYRAARELVRAGAAQVGSPWTFGVGRRSFTDVIHEDHLHIHQRAGTQ
ncbi:MAG: hypothetical protein Q8O56_15785 [Solirubrobacteraceae bacterium]|nr:hypothetical protein [Solirubrobacteraceae bacterium]